MTTLLATSFEVEEFEQWTKDQNINLNYDGSLDIFKGTLKASGSTDYLYKKVNQGRIFWNYTLSKPGLYHLLQVGDTTSQNSLLFPYITLQNGFQFEKIKRHSI